jgi:hypothetical protein
MFRGSERIRLITMLGTLCILGMIIYSSLNSRAGRSVADRPETERAQAAAEKLEITAKLPDSETVASGPTEEDPDEVMEAKNEFQALTDGTLRIGKLEMPAYRRVFSWVESQTYDQMKQRADRRVSFDDLMRSPDEFRGKLIHLNLTVNLVRECTDKSLSPEPLYELWGPTDKSGTWLYCVISPDVPAGIPVGEKIDESVKVEGYFFKLQGYLPGGAKPHDSPLKAPFVIGRAKWPAVPGTKSVATDNRWLYYAAAIFVLVGFFFSLAQFFSRRSTREHRAQLDQYKRQRHSTSSQEDESLDDDESATGDLPIANDEGFDFRKLS